MEHEMESEVRSGPSSGRSFLWGPRQMASLTLVRPQNGYLFRPQFERRGTKFPNVSDKTSLLHVNKAP